MYTNAIISVFRFFLGGSGKGRGTSCRLSCLDRASRLIPLLLPSSFAVLRPRIRVSLHAFCTFGLCTSVRIRLHLPPSVCINPHLSTYAY